MIGSFRSYGTEDIFNGRDTRAARSTCPFSLWSVAVRKLEQLYEVSIMVLVSTDRVPSHRGEILLEEFLKIQNEVPSLRVDV